MKLTRKSHVGQNIMLSRLHRGHLLEEVFACDESDRSYESNNGYAHAVVTGVCVVVVHTVLVAVCLAYIPTLG